MKHSWNLAWRLLRKAVESIENAPVTLATWVAGFSAIVLFRYSIEQFFLGFGLRSFESTHLTLTHYFLEFLFVAFCFMLITRLVGRGSLSQAANFTLFGFLLILTPPLTDYYILRNPGVFSLYEFGSLQELLRNFFTFFDDTPSIGITYGIRLEILVAAGIMALYGWVKRQSLLWAGLSAFLTYLMLYVVCTLPSWLTILFLGPQEGFLAITTADALAIFLAPSPLFGQIPSFVNAAHLKMALVYGVLNVGLMAFFVFRYFPKVAWALFHNARFPQLVYHGGLLFLGGVLAIHFTGPLHSWDIFHWLATAIAIIAVECAWLASVVINDVYDTKIDALTNPDRPLIQKTIPIETYKTFGWLFFLLSVFYAMLVYPPAVIFPLIYQAVAWLYSGPPLRLKRFPFIASALAAVASLCILFLGFVIVADNHSLAALPLALVLFLFVAYFLVIPLKDFKDRTGDEKDGVYTLPVLLGETRAKHLISAFLFLLFISSPFLLNERALFFAAFLFGSLAFWLVQRSSAQSRWFHYRKLMAWIVGLTTTYGLLVVLLLR